MLEGKALIDDTDMPVKLQIQAMAYASQALDLYDVLDCESIAAHIKKVQFLPSRSHLFVSICVYMHLGIVNLEERWNLFQGFDLGLHIFK